MNPKNSKLAWGILFISAHSPEPFLLYRNWSERPSLPLGEPSRHLLFTSRALARKYCRDEREKYRNHDNLCRDWRFRPVRMRETVQIDKRPKPKGG